MKTVFTILFCLFGAMVVRAQEGQVEYERVSLGQKVNSMYHDSAPVIKEPRLILAGFVYNEKTYDPVKASIRIEKASEVLKVGHSEPEYGEYSTSLPGGGKYIIRVSAEGYLASTDSVDLEDIIEEDTEIYKDLFLTPIEAGLSVRLYHIFFDDKASLRPESFHELDQVVELMEQNPNLQIEIGGYTDHQRAGDDHQKLSQGRAEAVRQYLLENRIGGKRVTAVGYDESQPEVADNTQTNLQSNSTVEFTVLKNE